MFFYKIMLKSSSLFGFRRLFPRHQRPQAVKNRITSRRFSHWTVTVETRRAITWKSLAASISCRKQVRWSSVGPRLIQVNEDRYGTPGDSHLPAASFDGGFAMEQRRIDQQMFDMVSNGETTVPVSVLMGAWKNAGLWKNDPRLAETLKKLSQYTSVARKENRHGDVMLDRDAFLDCIKDSRMLIRRALIGDFVVPDFSKFSDSVDEIHEECQRNNEGKVASNIPQLAKYKPELWGASVCTVDGQRHSVGDTGIAMTVQSSGKPINYSLALNELGQQTVHRYVGHEPSGESFNSIKLSSDRKPHNPMINPGAIVVTSLIKKDLSPSDRFEYIMNQYKRIVGNEFLAFNNSSFLSKRETGDRNFAIGYYLKENRCFPDGTSLEDTMNLFFQLCSIEINCNSGAVLAATLANGGVCPITGEEVLDPTSIRNTLTLMHSCGMYDYSGEFAFKVGLPAKSSVSGIILVVVPNVMGMCLWSPPLDRMGNSVRGVQFCEQFVRRFNFHQYDSLVCTPQKADPRVRKSELESDRVVNLLFGAYNGDLTALRRMALAKQDMKVADYDGRTALHLAAAEGHMDCVSFLVEKCGVSVSLRDRWGYTPIDDAIKFKQTNVQEYFELCPKDHKTLA